MSSEDPHQVLLAKKVCAQCPVVSSCFAAAEKIVAAFGMDHAQGVWGGLTLAERNTLAGLGRPPALCPGCGLICVPVNYATDRCGSCNPTARIVYADYRQQIEALFAAKATYQQVADALRLKKANLAAACNRWNLKVQTASRRGRRPLKECGTLAAKTRHARHGESWKNCACRHVAWKRGAPRRKGPAEDK